MAGKAREGKDAAEVAADAWAEHEADDAAELAPDAGADDAAPVEQAADEVSEVEESVEAAPDDGDARPRDKWGRFLPQEKLAAGAGAAGESGSDGAGAPVQAGADAAAVDSAAAADAGAAAAPKAGAAPASWRAAEREAFSRLTGADADIVRSAAHRREAQIEGAIREMEPIKRFANELAGVVEPHRDLIAMFKTTPLGAIESLFGTAARLYKGSPGDRVREVGDLIIHHQIDPSMLADYLDGKRVSEPNGQTHDPRVDSLLNEMRQQRGRETQERQQREMQRLGDFLKSKPYGSDVQDAFLHNVRLQREQGVEPDLARCYEVAVAMDPEVSKLDAQRKKAEQVKAAQATAQKARRAASIPKPSPAAPGRAAQRAKRHETAEDAASAAWDEVEGKVA